MSRLRQLGLVVGIGFALAGTARPTGASGGRHPLFDDQGTLTWYTSLDEAQANARASGRLIFIEQGRRRCPNCQSFVERVLTESNVRSRIQDIAIGLADDCDQSDPRVDRLLASGIPNPTMLPLCGFVTPELKWVTGWSGYMDTGSFGGHLTLAKERYDQVQRYRKRPAPSIQPALPSDVGDCPGGQCHLPPRPKAPVVGPVVPKPAPLVAPAPPPPAPPAPPPLPSPAPLAKVAPVPAPIPVPVKPLAPEVPPLATTPKPAPPTEQKPALPAPSGATTPARPVAGTGSRPIPAASPVTPPFVTPGPKPVATMDAVRLAAADGRWGEVLRLADASPRVTTAEKAELDAFVRRANTWVQESLASVVTSAKERQFSSARRTLTVLTTQLDGTTCAGLIDAERGSRAVERLSAVEQGSPDQNDTPEQLRKQAYSEFRGTRWATLFRGRPTGK